MAEEAQDALAEKMKAVYRLYQRNIRAVDPLVYQITLGARNGVPEEELLKLAAEALEKCDAGETIG
ncbi:MAG: hypothetical protein IKE24_04285 [Clostridia bacterium]|nr:hypothetical protein [Clostridia bacterium]